MAATLMPALGRVSVVVPTRNCLEQVKRGMPAMKSWLPQVGEVIVVDSESSDGTREFLSSELTGPHVRFIDHPPGLYASWNAGLQATTCEFVHISTAGDTISAEDLAALVAAALASQAAVVSAVPRFFDEAGNAVPGPRWPIHAVLDRHPGQDQVVLERAALLAVAMEFCQVPVSHHSWLGSSASNLYRRAIFDTFRFPTHGGHSGDMLFGLLHAASLRAAFLREPRGQFVLHPSPGSQADLFAGYGTVYAQAYEQGRAHLTQLLKTVLSGGPMGELTSCLQPSVEPSFWKALGFDAEAITPVIAALKSEIASERTKKEEQREKKLHAENERDDWKQRARRAEAELESVRRKVPGWLRSLLGLNSKH